MICNDTQELLRFLPPAARVLGLDLGTKTIGVALSDVGLQIASPYELISRKKFSRDMAQLSSMIDKQNVGGIIIGFPRELDGSIGKACHRVYAFIDEMEKYIVDMTRKRRAEVVDKTAAAYILQGALDHMNRHTDPGENAEADHDDIEGEED